MKQKYFLLIFSAVLIAFAVVARIVPHVANIAPIAALALFSGVYMKKTYAFVVPIAVMFVSDIVVEFYALPIMAAVYGSFALIVLLGIMLKQQKTVSRTIGTTVLGSLLFFAVTNWAVWAFGSLYTPTLSGLAQSYLMGLPFLKGTLVGDLLYVTAFFGIYEYATKALKKRAVERKEAVVTVS